MTWDGYRLVEDTILIANCVNEATYKAARYQENEYDHLRENAIEQLRVARNIIDETLEDIEEE